MTDTCRRFERSGHEASIGGTAIGMAVKADCSGVTRRFGWFKPVLPHPIECPGALFRQGRQIMDWHWKATA
jgi:hypothetical protein